MKNISLFLAIKYYKSKGKGFVSFHSGIAIFGIAVGVEYELFIVQYRFIALSFFELVFFALGCLNIFVVLHFF